MSGRNKTLQLTPSDTSSYAGQLLTLEQHLKPKDLVNRIVHQDMIDAARFLPSNFVDLLFLDPPYNLNKKFNDTAFHKQSIDAYNEQLGEWIKAVLHTLKPDASIYICGDWLTSTSIYSVASTYFKVRNRITWEREKGRGAKSNWKNCSEDIWFCTRGNHYYFDADAVKLRRKVVAPYRNEDKTPKDWDANEHGNFRLTYPSNLWTDITVPFWSMPENTEHPTQKPEKILAKLLLASCPPNGVVLDPFAGSGTTLAAAKKLSRQFIGIETDKKYCLLAQKRLALAEENHDIQGYSNGVFWERNSLSQQKKTKRATS